MHAPECQVLFDLRFVHGAQVCKYVKGLHDLYFRIHMHTCESIIRP